MPKFNVGDSVVILEIAPDGDRFDDYVKRNKKWIEYPAIGQTYTVKQVGFEEVPDSTDVWFGILDTGEGGTDWCVEERFLRLAEPTRRDK